MSMSSAAFRDLGQRWCMALGDAGWRSGMLVRWRFCGVDRLQRSHETRPFGLVRRETDDELPWPDLSDAATRGAALEVVRVAFGQPTAHLVTGHSGWWFFGAHVGAADHDHGTLRTDGRWAYDASPEVFAATEAECRGAAAEVWVRHIAMAHELR